MLSSQNAARDILRDKGVRFNERQNLQIMRSHKLAGVKSFDANRMIYKSFGVDRFVARYAVHMLDVARMRRKLYFLVFNMTCFA